MLNDGSKKMTEYQKNIQSFKENGGIDPSLPKEKNYKGKACYACGRTRGLSFIGIMGPKEFASHGLAIGSEAFVCDSGPCRLRRAWSSVCKPRKGELLLYNSTNHTNLTEREYVSMMVDKKMAESQSRNAKYQDPNTPRRGRGRPKGENSKEPKDPNAPKRGRGRPKKEKSEPTEPKDPNAPKRGRGRPKKEGVVAKAPVDPNAPKRGRGRPKKEESAAVVPPAIESVVPQA